MSIQLPMIMMDVTVPPVLQIPFYQAHAQLLCSSYRHWTRRSLLEVEGPIDDLAGQLFRAPFGIVSHGTEADPIFNFGNAVALKLFEMSWDQFTRLPSRESAEPVNREERAALLERVTAQGYIDDYRGVRISASGRRFMIERATVWNLVDASGVYRGQAAKLDQWSCQ